MSEYSVVSKTVFYEIRSPTLVSTASKDELQYILNRSDTISMKYGCQLNKAKNQIIIDRAGNNRPNNRVIADIKVSVTLVQC